MYRVTPKSEDLPRVMVRRGRVAFSVLVLDISSGGAGLIVLPEDVPRLRRAVEAERDSGWQLLLEGGGLEEPLILAAETAGARPCDMGVRLAVRFSMTPAQRKGLDAHLLSVFNQRKAARVEANLQEPVTVTMAVPDGKPLGVGLLRDVSTVGLGVLVPETLVPKVSGLPLVALTFELPREAQPVHVVGEVVRVASHTLPPELQLESVSLIGVSLDGDEVSGARESQALGRYVVRQQVLLRRGEKV